MPPTNNYQIPAYGISDPAHLLGWCLSAVAEGEAWLRAQSPSQSWEEVLLRLSERAGGNLQGQSNTEYPKVKRIAKELVASLSSFNHAGEFQPLADMALYEDAHLLTRLDENWYRRTNPGTSFRGAIQNGIAFGTGYLVETWDKHFHGNGVGDIRLDVFGPQDITFIQLPKDHNIQKAYGVLIRYEMPINLAKAVYSETNRAFAESLVPDRSSPGWIAAGLRKIQEFLSPALRVGGRMQEKQNGSFPTVDIYHLYTMDRSINAGMTPITMGTYGTNWSYEVPCLGQQIPTGINGETRPAQPEDCLLFPLRRLTIFARSGICYDNSSPWWHGQVPVARLRFGDWAWEALGSSQVADLLPLQDGISETMRGIEDSITARLDPPKLYDDQLVSPGFAQAFSGRKGGVMAAANLSLGDPIKFPIDPRFYDVPMWIEEWTKQQEGRMDYLAAVQDLTAIAKASQIPAADSLEKLLEMAGPIVQDMVKAVADPLKQLGEWRKAYYFQFYTAARIIEFTGEDGKIAKMQFTADKLVNRVPDEDAAQHVARTRRKISEFVYDVSQSGVNELNRMTTKLFYLQLMKAGFPLSWWTFAEIAQIPNFGPPPKDTNTEMERWIAQKRIEIEMAVDLQKQLAESGIAPGGGAAGAVPGLPPELPAGPGGPGGDRGRPPTNQKPPHIVTKDHGERSTVSTS